MSQRIAIVDFGAGNLHSVAHALQKVGAEPVLASTPEALLQADKAVLPGVGELGSCMAELAKRGLDQALLEYIGRRPLLGVCVGMQLLAEGGEEGGGARALGLVPGLFRKFPGDGREHDGRRLKVPHMGWTPVRQNAHPCWKGIADGSRFYFVHSYYLAVPEAGADAADKVAAVAEHGLPFVAALADEQLFATQFHPEKSGADGLRLYANFVEWQP